MFSDEVYACAGQLSANSTSEGMSSTLSKAHVFLTSSTSQNVDNTAVATSTPLTVDGQKRVADIAKISTQVGTLLPQLSNFINQFNTTVSESNVNIVTDSFGNMTLDLNKNISDEQAINLSNRISIIDRLISTRSQDIDELLQKALKLENEVKSENPHYVSQVNDSMEEFRKLRNSYNH